MPADYHFTTRWSVRADTHEVFEVLRDPLDLPRWWPDVYISARELKPGDSHGLGQQVAFHSRGALPYTLRWTMTASGGEVPHRIELQARGDFVGTGVWTLWCNGDTTQLQFVWHVEARKPLLRFLSPWLRSIFAWNHAWAMQTGEARLRQEVARRRNYADGAVQSGHGDGVAASKENMMSRNTRLGLIAAIVTFAAGLLKILLLAPGPDTEVE